jgi:chorismate synthase
MAGNTIGKEFAVTYFGESHGRCVGIVIDGCPAGLPITDEDVQKDLDRRVPRESGIVSTRIESDKVETLSGVFEGYTSGAPICMLVWNKDVDDSPYIEIRNKPRPGHADYPARLRYGGFNDFRGGGIFSGRSTASLVLAGAIARRLLEKFNIHVLAHTIEIAGIRVDPIPSFEEIRNSTYQNAVRCANPTVAKRMEAAILEVASQGDSVGGIVEGIALNVPTGVGEPLYDSLDADLAKLLFDIPGVKAVEFGVGLESSRLKGSSSNDEYIVQSGKVTTATNRTGGIIGGLSIGQPVKVHVAFKPTSSIAKMQKTVDLNRMENQTIEVKGRHDPCIVPKAVPIVEAAISIVLTDHLIRVGIIPRVLGSKRT